MGRSEVAELRRRIELELEAMQRGMHGFALGTARHEFIRTRMNQLGVCRERLAEHIGENAANEIVGSLYVEAFK